MIHEFQNGDKVLQIFLNFDIDKSLPKFKNDKKIKIDNNVVSVFDSETTFNINSDWNTNTSLNIFSVNEEVKEKTEVTPKKSLYNWIRELFNSSKKISTDIKLPPDVIFKMAKSGCIELKKCAYRIEKYNKLIEDAKSNGQKSLVEKLVDNKNLTILESELYSIDDIKFLEESDVIDFADLCIQGLRLDWIKNFVRIIPDNVAEKKKQMDEYGIFDNYVILHYDPEGKSTQLTKEEIEYKRDPILFGVIYNSRRLYFIGDWIDELCELTLDEIADSVPISELQEDPTKVSKTEKIITLTDKITTFSDL